MTYYNTKSIKINPANVHLPDKIESKQESAVKGEIVRAAEKYLALKLSVIPVGSDKRPLFSWSNYQKQLPTAEEVLRWFRKDPPAIAVITGEISGCLEVLDVDCKYDLSGSLMEDFCELIKETHPNCFQN